MDSLKRCLNCPAGKLTTYLWTLEDAGESSPLVIPANLGNPEEAEGRNQ